MNLPHFSKEIEGYDGFYRVDIFGHIWSCRAHSGGGLCNKRGLWRRLNTRVNGYGYPTVELRKNGSIKHPLVHALVLAAFRGACPPGYQTRHLNSDRKNSKLSNLVWGTPSQNQLDRRTVGTDNGGERNRGAKLNWNAVRKIRLLRFTREYTHKQLASRFGVTAHCIAHILNERTWRDDSRNIE